MSIIRITISVLIFNLPVLLPVIVEPGKYSSLEYWCSYTFYFLLTVIYFWRLEFSANLRFNKKSTDLFLEEFLRKIRKQAGADCLAFVMLPSFNLNPFLGKDKFLKKCLFDEYPLNLNDTLEFRIIRPCNTGIEGIAYKEGDIKVADFEQARKKYSHTWNMRLVDLKLIGEYKSGIAMPIEDSKTKGKIIGVIVVYSPNKLQETPFEKLEFQAFLREWNEMISILIRGAK